MRAFLFPVVLCVACATTRLIRRTRPRQGGRVNRIVQQDAARRNYGSPPGNPAPAATGKDWGHCDPPVVKLKMLSTWHRMELRHPVVWRHAGKADVVLERVAFARMNQGSESWRSGPNSAALTGDFWERIFNLSVVVLLALAATAKFLAAGSNAQFWRRPTRCCSRRPTGREVRPPGGPSFWCVTPNDREAVIRMGWGRQGVVIRGADGAKVGVTTYEALAKSNTVPNDKTSVTPIWPAFCSESYSQGLSRNDSIGVWVERATGPFCRATSLTAEHKEGEPNGVQSPCARLGGRLPPRTAKLAVPPGPTASFRLSTNRITPPTCENVFLGDLIIRSSHFFQSTAPPAVADKERQRTAALDAASLRASGPCARFWAAPVLWRLRLIRDPALHFSGILNLSRGFPSPA